MEFLIRNFDSTNPDPDKDRSGCRKRGMCDAVYPDGHRWGPSEGLPKFVIISCNLSDSDIANYEGLRKKWFDVNGNVYMYQRYKINTVTMDAAVEAGGFLELTKAQFIAAIVDMAE